MEQDRMEQDIMFSGIDIARRFGRAVRQARAIHGFSQETLAGLTGLHRTYIGVIERGEKNITLINATRIADAVGLSLTELLQLMR